MEYDEQDNSNYSCAADHSHILEFTAEEGGDSDDDNSNIVINDDGYENSYYDEDSVLVSETSISDNNSYIGHQLTDDSRSSPDLPIGDADWREDDSVPEGWKIKEFITKAGQRLEHVQGPTGQFFPGRKAAVDWMREQGYFSNEDIELMQSKLKIKWTEDDPTIPEGQFAVLTFHLYL